MSKRRTLWIAVGTTLVVAVATGAQQGRWASQSDEIAQALINMERQWAEADCDGNPALQTILADDFQGTAPDGSRYTKAQEVQDTKSSKHESHDCRLGETKFHFFGDNLAILYGTESRTQKENDGSERSRSLIWTDTWLKRNGRWQIIAAQDNWVLKEIPKSCPVTKPPAHPFVPPYPAEFYPGNFWFGTEKLWINLLSDGTWELGHYSPSETAFRQKLLWWHKGFDGAADQQPILKVTGKRLDSPAPTFEENESAEPYGGPNAQFIVVGLDIPTVGCWNITGRFGTAELSFVVWVTPK